MARRKSLRHYTLFQANSADDTPADTADDETQHEGSPTRISSPGQVTRPSKRRRAKGTPSSPTTPSSRSNEPHKELAALPADLLFRIADDGPSPSVSWLDPGVDLMNFSSTCRAVWLAVREVVERRFVIRAGPQSCGMDVFARTRSVTGLGEEGGLPLPDSDRIENRKTPSRDLATTGCTAATNAGLEEFILNWRRDTHRIPGARIRHLVFHINAPSALLSYGLRVAATIRSMPRLETCVVVFATEDEAISTSPYTVGFLGYDILTALSSLPRLRELYLSGIRVIAKTLDGGEMPLPTFKALKSFTVNASHDTALQLVNAAPQLKEVKLWRDFARSPRIPTPEWWSEDIWRTLEHVELRGFSGTQGRALNDEWKLSLTKLRSLSPVPNIPLKSIRLCEAYQYTHFVNEVLPTFAGLPHLRKFTCMVWRDRNWSPRFLGLIATHLPDLEELAVGVENSGLNWWPGSAGDYGAQLVGFPHLHTFTWNYTQYADTNFEEARKTLYPQAMLLVSRCPTLRRLKWLDESIHLVHTIAPNGRVKWKWSDELEPKKIERPETPAPSSKSKGKGKAKELLEDENKPPRTKARRSLFGDMLPGTSLGGGGGSAEKGKGGRKTMGDWEDPQDDSGFFEATAAVEDGSAAEEES
ncbi:hypothetical protein BCR35DRAFT_301597 [Leucosporidium creatinivorum]|uniref:Uncharacterized protein n=1 Tax=Leucosporidium creatinivorum TaxID=106004 RepID=A0A1Y2FWR4_9BASI|nr:hypothetical protein BCR35DRAFT_301597 [Leucosporidium creatinivorum]